MSLFTARDRFLKAHHLSDETVKDAFKDLPNTICEATNV